ncbi:MerR family transcriptional regulator [Streptomyces spiroverticillatus]|uniref:MerR family transcriptional regulator n=1 Tax=Streptomyces finlayi TaxID=67296 RepID=A0A918X1U0_9ACTN|nr:MerR family transcriptional regulator [Streptomyces finlayi]GHA21125.1 MerR family transcriptional regulator [Streptomyces spiroverticillatus]GHD03620.1 MerR family transcriptional regulator [Streptomyces finlayi]
MEHQDPEQALTVGRAAALVGVSVKTLHHWDKIGLMRPTSRTRSGYRVYGAEDIARIHRVLVYRELGLPLAEIGRILDDPDTDARAHLRHQRAQLTERIGRLERMVVAVDRMLETSGSDGGMRLTPEEQVEIFGADWQPEWVDGAEERYGDSPQWAQYQERASRLSREEWEEVAAATRTLHQDLAAALRAGTAPGSPGANALAERQRALLSTYFDCTLAMQVCISRMYVTEPGYADSFEALEPGLTKWLRDIVCANAAAQGVDPETAAWPA